MANFLCLGAGILLLAFWGVLAEAERLASVEDLQPQSNAETQLPGVRFTLRISGRS
jgi:hypothetical protein